MRSLWNSEYSFNTFSSLYSAQLMVLKLFLFLLQCSEARFRYVSIILFHRFWLRNLWRCCTTNSFYTAASLHWSTRLWGILHSFVRSFILMVDRNGVDSKRVLFSCKLGSFFHQTQCGISEFGWGYFAQGKVSSFTSKSLFCVWMSLFSAEKFFPPLSKFNEIKTCS